MLNTNDVLNFTYCLIVIMIVSLLHAVEILKMIFGTNLPFTVNLCTKMVATCEWRATQKFSNSYWVFFVHFFVNHLEHKPF